MDEFKHLAEGMLLTMMYAALRKYAWSDIFIGDNIEKLLLGVGLIRKTIWEDGVKRDESTNGYRTEKFLELSHFIL
jgi:hypothetical protein